MTEIFGIAAERAAVIAEAKTWFRTPYHHEAFVKGAGVDCRVIALIYSAVGLIPEVSMDKHPIDWALHNTTEYYLEKVVGHAVEVEVPQPGDFVLWKFGRCYSHAAIVEDWPMVLHTFQGNPFGYDDAERQVDLRWFAKDKPRLKKFFTLSRWVK